MRIRTLGCSGGISAELRTTCFWIDDDILVDAGTGVGELTLEEMRHIRHIFITHSHLDHIAGLPLMVDSVFGDANEPIIIHAQQATIDALKRHIFNWTVWPDFTKLPAKESPILNYEVMQPGEVLDIDGRRFEMVPVNHVVPCVAYVIEQQDGRVFAFSGDTTTNDSLWEGLNKYPRLDVLVVESAFSNADIELSRMSCHYCPSLLAKDLLKLNHCPELYVTHLKPGVEDIIFNECLELIDGFDIKRLSGGLIIQL